MNRDTILSLTGSALSEAVAEHVMGWQRLSQAAVVEQRGSTWTNAKGDWHLIPHGPPLRPGDAGLFAIVAEVWEPHKDMRAAFVIVEHLYARGVAFAFDLEPGAGVKASFYDPRNEGEAGRRAIVDTGAHPATAICRAALFIGVWSANAGT